MYARKMGLGWEVHAPAKLNLYLEVLGHRPDGFHELETLMAPINVYDRLVWLPPQRGKDPDFSVEYDPRTAPQIVAAAPAERSNLAWRAAELVAQAGGVQPRGRIRLFKRIPVGGGLGGGSSNAAAALLLANAAWRAGLSRSRLAGLAAELGSDVPFFLAGQSAVCRGRGERVDAVPGLPRLDVVVVKPSASVLTTAAFQALDRQGAPQVSRQESADRVAALIAALRRGSLAETGRRMFNRLQAAAMELCPCIEHLRLSLTRCGLAAQQLTGSGSCYFGIARSTRQARRLAHLLSSWKLGTVFSAATCR